MKTFSVFIRIEGTTEVIIKAENENEAREKVYQMIDNDEIMLPFEIEDVDVMETGGEKP